MEWFNAMTRSQWWASSRHYITFGAGILGTLGVISVIQQKEALDAIDHVAIGLKELATGVGALLTIFAPIINGWIASHKAKPTTQVQTVADLAKDSSSIAVEAKTALLKATVSLPEVKNIEIAPVNPSPQAKADVVALNAATPPAVVMSSVPQTQSLQ